LRRAGIDYRSGFLRRVQSAARDQAGSGTPEAEYAAGPPWRLPGARGPARRLPSHENHPTSITLTTHPTKFRQRLISSSRPDLVGRGAIEGAAAPPEIEMGAIDYPKRLPYPTLSVSDSVLQIFGKMQELFVAGAD
jgi:hypothetical protein